MQIKEDLTDYINRNLEKEIPKKQMIADLGMPDNTLDRAIQHLKLFYRIGEYKKNDNVKGRPKTIYYFYDHIRKIDFDEMNTAKSIKERKACFDFIENHLNEYPIYRYRPEDLINFYDDLTKAILNKYYSRDNFALQYTRKKASFLYEDLMAVFNKFHVDLWFSLFSESTPLLKNCIDIVDFRNHQLKFDFNPIVKEDRDYIFSIIEHAIEEKVQNQIKIESEYFDQLSKDCDVDELVELYKAKFNHNTSINICYTIFKKNVFNFELAIGKLEELSDNI